MKTRGVRGEVVAELLTDFPERFEGLRFVYLASTGRPQVEEIERYWFHQKRIVLKFVGWDSPEAVRELVGCEVQVPEADRVVLPADTYYDSDLEECRVCEAGRELGRVAKVVRTGGSASVLLVRDSVGAEFMVPLGGPFVVSVDLEAKVIEVSLPPGLLDLAVPGPGGR